MIIAVVLVGVLLIGMVVVNAQAAKLQYSINQLTNQNNLLENEIGTLNIKIERETSIGALEKYATEELACFIRKETSACMFLHWIPLKEAG